MEGGYVLGRFTKTTLNSDGTVKCFEKSYCTKEEKRKWIIDGVDGPTPHKILNIKANLSKIPVPDWIA
jgi:hypothetical protein